MRKEVRSEKGTSTSLSPPRQDQDLRTRLLEAGQRVFAETGYAGTRVDDIIEAADTSRATFYRYFKSKDALFTELSRICFVDIRVTTRAIASVTPGDEARGQLIELLKHWRDLLDSSRRRDPRLVRTGRRPRLDHLRRGDEGIRRLFEELLTPILAARPGRGSTPRCKRHCCSS